MRSRSGLSSPHPRSALCDSLVSRCCLLRAEKDLPPLSIFLPSNVVSMTAHRARSHFSEVL